MAVDALKPGIYKDVPHEDYLTWDAVNFSRLKVMLKSPAHYQWCEPQAKTAALSFGTVCHAALLEPATFDQRYAVLPAYEGDEDNKTQAGKPTRSRATKYYRARVAEFAENNKGKELIGGGDWNRAWQCSEACHRNSRAAELLGAAGDCEVSIVWLDETVIDGKPVNMLFKARPDKIIAGQAARELTGGESGHLLVDLKTTADLDKFGTSIARYRYDMQLEFYRWGLSKLTGVADICTELLAVESEPPHCVHAAPVDLRQAGRDLPRLRLLLIDCERSGEWPEPYEPGEGWRLPGWFTARDVEPLTAGGVELGY